MRAATLRAPNAIELTDLPDPVPGEESALLRPLVVGICGTDLSIVAGKIPVDYPRILGHEICAEVVEGTSLLLAGTRVVVDPSIACGRCDRCQEARENLCANGALLGRDADGGFATLLAAPSANLHPVPDAVPDEVVPLIQVLTTCLHGQRRVDVVPGEAVVVLGLGVTGLLHLQLAKRAGAAPVIGVTRSAAKRALADRLGADLTLDANDDDVAAAVRAETRGGPDLVVEAAGTVATLARAVEVVRPGGRILAYGTITESEGRLSYYDLYYKEIDIVNSRAARPRDFPAAVAAAASGAIALSPLVDHVFGLEDTATALVAGRRDGALKIVVGTGA